MKRSLRVQVTRVGDVVGVGSCKEQISLSNSSKINPEEISETIYQ